MSRKGKYLVTPVTIADAEQKSHSFIAVQKVSPKVTPNEHRTVCPRCNALLRINYDEPECLQCGYADYTYNPSTLNRSRKSLLAAGTRYVLRYVGEFPSLIDTIAHVKLQRLRNRIVYGVCCPFCSRPMMQSSLSGKRKEVREERYKCAEGHRVSLTPSRGGNLGWK